MRVRQAEERDLPALRKWFDASGFDYEFPENLLQDPFIRVTVYEDEEGNLANAVAIKRTTEAYLLVNPEWKNPRWRLEALTETHEEMRDWLDKNGWSESNAFVPPQVERAFGRRLERIFGWIPGRWQHYSRRTEAQGNEPRRK